jgi:hypothetical protein
MKKLKRNFIFKILNLKVNKYSNIKKEVTLQTIKEAQNRIKGQVEVSTLKFSKFFSGNSGIFLY